MPAERLEGLPTPAACSSQGQVTQLGVMLGSSRRHSFLWARFHSSGNYCSRKRGYKKGPISREDVAPLLLTFSLWWCLAGSAWGSCQVLLGSGIPLALQGAWVWLESLAVPAPPRALSPTLCRECAYLGCKILCHPGWPSAAPVTSRLLLPHCSAPRPLSKAPP